MCLIVKNTYPDKVVINSWFAYTKCLVLYLISENNWIIMDTKSRLLPVSYVFMYDFLKVRVTFIIIIKAILRKLNFRHVYVMQPRLAHYPQHHIKSCHVTCRLNHRQQHFICGKAFFNFSIFYRTLTLSYF